ncbi:MAG: VOC family protein [Acidimicrobiales bacterium]
MTSENEASGRRGSNSHHQLGIDLWPTGTTRDTQIDRAQLLGAVHLADRRRSDGAGWVVFADPEDNEFCIGSSAAERALLRPRSGQA